jgi:hypothetical protein
MTWNDDSNDWMIWGQRGRALIQGEWLEGTALYRNSKGTMVCFLCFALVEAADDINGSGGLLQVIQRCDFRLDSDSPPVFGEE